MEMMNRIVGNPILEAADEGNVEFLLERLQTEEADYFLTRSKNADGEPELNIIHVAVIRFQEEFLKTALERLPSSTVYLLLCHTSPGRAKGCNALHFAVATGDLNVIKLLVKFAKSSFPSSSLSPSSSSKPWLTKDNYGRTPLQMAFLHQMENCALELLSLDMELQSNMVDKDGVSPLFRALFSESPRVAVKILTSGHSYSTAGYGALSLLDVAPASTEEVCKLLVEKHPEMITKVDEGGKTILQKWILIGKVWPFELLLKGEKISSSSRKDFNNLLCMTDKLGRNALHAAAYYPTEEVVQIVRLLVEAYNNEEKGEALQIIPWKQRDLSNMTPACIALVEKNEKIALYYISLLEVVELFSDQNFLYNAVKHGCGQAAEKLLMKMVEHPFFTELVKIRGDDGTGKTVLHVAPNCTETIAALLVEKLPGTINECDDDGKTPLEVAAEFGTTWLIKLLLTKEPSSYKKSAWVEACKNGHIPAIEAFINYSSDFRAMCLQTQDSPIYHIKLGSYNQYQEFYAIPLIQEMKNMLDSNHSTPLHRALERKDILLAELLLSDDSVSKTIRDNSGNTATSLLVELCSQDDAWEAMCRRVGINPRLRTNFIQPNTMGVGASIPRAITASVGEMRGTVAVVAALLATLTFAAGFTVPGGLDQVTGEALLAKKASFLIFIIADTYAMCCAMLVVFFLMWSMVIDDQDRSLILVDRSVLILVQSFYGTLLAFMTAVFTVIYHKALWASIVVLFMCSFVSLIAFSANTTVLYKFLDKLAPSAITKTRNLARSLEEQQQLHQRVESTVSNKSDDPLSNV